MIGISVAMGLTAAASCGGGHTVTSAAVPPPEAVNNLCDGYGTQIHRQAVNARATTAGAVADSMRAVNLNPAPWGNQPRAEQVARCEYPVTGPPAVSDVTLCPHHTAAIVRGTLYFFIDAHGHRTAIPDAVLRPPCSRT
jgi:hypothetical protein